MVKNRLLILTHSKFLLSRIFRTDKEKRHIIKAEFIMCL